MSKHKHPHDPAASRRDQFIAPLPRRRTNFSWNAVIVAAGLAFLAAAIYSTRSVPGAGFGSTIDAEILPAGDVTLAALVGLMVVMTTMMAAVTERTQEIGILRAVGFRRAHVAQGSALQARAGLKGLRYVHPRRASV